MRLICAEDLEREERERVDTLSRLSGYGPRTTTGIVRQLVGFQPEGAECHRRYLEPSEEGDRWLVDQMRRYAQQYNLATEQ